MKRLNIYSFFALVLLAAGCSKFTDVAPKGKLIPRTVTDYEGFMNDIVLADAAYLYSEYMSDDLQLTDAAAASQAANRTGKSYFWDKELLKSTEDDAEWNTPYNRIYYCNLVLDNIGNATEGTEADKNRIRAEAMIHRAYYLFNLANLYGKDYQETTAATDLAVPVMLKADLEAKSTRASVKEVYDKVITDLTAALNTPELPDFGRNYVHPGKAGALAILARVYFLKGDLKTAAEYADKALAKRSTLLDYNTLEFINPARPFSGVKNKPTPEANPENLFSRTNSSSGIFVRFMISPDLHTMLGEKDLRFVFNFTRLTTTGAVSANPLPDYLNGAPNFSIGVPEMMLIKAEYLAKQGQINDALTLLNNLRLSRFKPADYTALTAATPEEALVKVLEERRRELFYHGTRWFDLKRLNRTDAFKKTLTRSHNGRVETLQPNSPRYLMQIAPKILGINPGILPNER
ncbi:MAG: RagB/SusD family nutrient uptake outer membrane protein [Pseudobacter sp.]|uniref:RagB/SusD family nutrient uptake outer membrane protein n=1 Tax=Pseudobacter sp. TaxID=2045420 RepID=UPI003F7E8C36